MSFSFKVIPVGDPLRSIRILTCQAIDWKVFFYFFFRIAKSFPNAHKCSAQRKEMIHEMYLSPTKEAALKTYDGFLKLYTAKYPRACNVLREIKSSSLHFMII